ncbi:hypothetical protein LguiA_025236 [Lonicera macranthoides]
MGCCASTNNPSSDPPFHLPKSNRQPPPHPLPLIEEETVKEVLSETPTPKLKIPKNEEEPKKTPPKQDLDKIYEEQETKFEKKKPTLINAEEEISEVSEICSNLSLSESVSTTTLTEKDDRDGEVRQRINRSPAKFRNRSLSGDLSSRREGVVGKLPAKRSDPSRGRVKSVPGVERRAYVADGRRRESGESSVRRSRSPATRMESGTTRFGPRRSPSRRKAGNSPGRVKPEPLGKTQKMDGGNGEGKVNSPATATTNESLENPLVSLECFIFL